MMKNAVLEWRIRMFVGTVMMSLGGSLRSSARWVCVRNVHSLLILLPHTHWEKSKTSLLSPQKKKKMSSCLNDITVSTSFTSGHGCLDLFNLSDLVVNVHRNRSGWRQGCDGTFIHPVAYLFRLWPLTQSAEATPLEHFKQMQVKVIALSINFRFTCVNINTKKYIFCYESDLMFGRTRV